MDLKELMTSLEAKIQNAYEQGTTLEEAERLAAEFLHAQIQVSAALKTADLDSRMKKSGLKAVKAAVYADECKKADKKPTEAALENAINLNEIVQAEQNGLDTAEVDRDALSRYFSILQNAHIFFRGISRGRFE